MLSCQFDLTPPILFPDYWLICPTWFPFVTLLICSLYKLLVFAILCQFVAECFLFLPCLALPCLALPCPCPALPCPALPCPALPCPALPCPALPSLAKPCQLYCFLLRGSLGCLFCFILFLWSPSPARVLASSLHPNLDYIFNYFILYT